MFAPSFHVHRCSFNGQLAKVSHMYMKTFIIILALQIGPFLLECICADKSSVGEDQYPIGLSCTSSKQNVRGEGEDQLILVPCSGGEGEDQLILLPCSGGV
eukprot:scpid111813/ scgid24274/ 